MKTSPELQEVAEAGAAWCCTPYAPPVKEALPYYPSSDKADAWLIGAWCQYWTGHAPRAIRRTRGHCSRVLDHHYNERVVAIVDEYDHREGVKVKE